MDQKLYITVVVSVLALYIIVGGLFGVDGVMDTDDSVNTDNVNETQSENSEGDVTTEDVPDLSGQQPTVEVSPVEVQAIAELRELELALLQYSATTGGFPNVASTSTTEYCAYLNENTSGFGYNSLMDTLRVSLPSFNWGNRDYFYCSDAQGSTGDVTTRSEATMFVIGVIDMSSDNPALADDVDNEAINPLGLAIPPSISPEGCGEPSNDTVYCLRGGDV